MRVRLNGVRVVVARCRALGCGDYVPVEELDAHDHCKACQEPEESDECELCRGGGCSACLSVHGMVF